MKTQSTVIAGLAAVLLLSGCITAGTKANFEALNETRRAIDRNTTATLAVGAGTVTNSIAPIDAAAAKLGEEAGASDARIDKLREELAKQQLEFRTFVTGALAVAGEVATELVPGGSAAARVLGVLKKNSDQARATADKAQEEGEAAKKEAAAATVEAQKLVTNLKAELAARDELLKQQLSAKEEMQRKEMEFARKELTALSAQQKAELHQELLAVARENGVEGADQMSTEELLSVLGAGGLGLAGLLRTFGKSRSQAEIEQLKAKVNEVQTVQVERVQV